MRVTTQLQQLDPERHLGEGCFVGLGEAEATLASPLGWIVEVASHGRLGLCQAGGSGRNNRARVAQSNHHGRHRRIASHILDVGRRQTLGGEGIDELVDLLVSNSVHNGPP